MPKTPTLTPAQASYVVERLIAERKLTAADIHQYLQGLQAEIRSLEQRIEALRSHAPAATLNAAPTAAAAKAPKAARTASKKRGGGKKDTRAGSQDRSRFCFAHCRRKPRLSTRRCAMSADSRQRSRTFARRRHRHPRRAIGRSEVPAPTVVHADLDSSREAGELRGAAVCSN